MKEAPVVHVGDRVRYHYTEEGRKTLHSVVATVKAVYDRGGVVLDYEHAGLVRRYGRSAYGELHRMTTAAWFSSEPRDGSWSEVVWSQHARPKTPRFAVASMDSPVEASKQPSVWANVPKPTPPDDLHVTAVDVVPNKNDDVFDDVLHVTKDVLSSMGPFKLGKHILTHSHKYEKKSRDEGLELFQAAITNSVMTGAWRGEPASIKKTVSKSELVSTAYSIACDIARTRNEVTSTDVLAALRDAGVDTSGVDPRFIGAVFRKRGWRRVGSRACGSHGRSVSVWALG